MYLNRVCNVCKYAYSLFQREWMLLIMVIKSKSHMSLIRSDILERLERIDWVSVTLCGCGQSIIWGDPFSLSPKKVWHPACTKPPRPLSVWCRPMILYVLRVRKEGQAYWDVNTFSCGGHCCYATSCGCIRTAVWCPRRELDNWSQTVLSLELRIINFRLRFGVLGSGFGPWAH